jgi:hypothetical protein
MKTLKLAVVALSLGFFAASCGNSETTTPENTDTTVVAQPETPAATTPAPVDSPATTPAPVDSPAATPAPAAH